MRIPSLIHEYISKLWSWCNWAPGNVWWLQHMRMIWELLRRCEFSIVNMKSTGRQRNWLIYSGLNTVYIQRTTEDLDEDMDIIRKEVDLFIDGTSRGEDCGLGELAALLSVWFVEDSSIAIFKDHTYAANLMVSLLDPMLISNRGNQGSRYPEEMFVRFVRWLQPTCEGIQWTREDLENHLRLHVPKYLGFGAPIWMNK